MKYLGQELSKFHKQLKFAINQYQSPKIDKAKVQNIVICGLGGSGIAGQIIKNYFADKMHLPVDVVADYVLPKYVSTHTLVIACSYSGDTEETLNAYAIAHEKGAQIVVITKGGKLLALAEEHGYTVYKAEGGFQPRVALGYSLGYLLMLFYDLLGQHKTPELLLLTDKMSNASDYIARSASLVSAFDKTIKQKYIIVADTYYQALAVRLANQIQENAKLEAFAVILPEANHNVIETYYEKWDGNYIFLNSGSHLRTNQRFYFIKELIKKQGNSMMEIPVADNSLSSLLDSAYLNDWISLQIADKVSAISNTVPNINELKKFLSEQK